MDFTIIHEFPAPDLEARWRRGLANVAVPSHYDAPEFFREPFWTGKKPFAVLALDGGDVAGALTGLHLGQTTQSGLNCRPQIWVDRTKNTEAALNALGRGLLEESGPSKLVVAYTWPSLPLAAFEPLGFRRRELAGNVMLDLTMGPDKLFKQFAHERRKNIRGALRNNVQVSVADTPEAIDEAYQVYRHWYHANTRKVIESEEISEAHFKQTWALPTNRRMFVARYNGKMVACTSFRFHRGGLIEASENFSLAEYFHVRPNDLVYWRAIEWACAEGFPLNSLGGSHQFHRKAGGPIVPILRYRLDRTFFHRYDLEEAVRDRGRRALRSLPPRVETFVRHLIGHEIRLGW
jgi:hypothetical protein